jgi:hypothetical protein
LTAHQQARPSTLILGWGNLSRGNDALTPEALLQVFADVEASASPAMTLLAIRGEAFVLGAGMRNSAHSHLALALAWGLAWAVAQPKGAG